MNSSANFVCTIDLSLVKKIKQDLENQGFKLTQPSYTIFQAKKKGVSCTLYESGKCLIQGKDKDHFITYYLEPEILGTFAYSYPHTTVDTTPHIGIDEAGKGDLFGPLCIAALYADSDQISTLTKMGIRDSKKISDTSIINLANKMKKTFISSIIQIFPKRYNELYKKWENLNLLLGWGHATAIEKIMHKTPCTDVLIDQFANENVVLSALKEKNLDVNLSQKHRGEEDIVVAGASILARAAFIQGLEELSHIYNLKLPKGASAQVIQAGKQFVHSHGKEKFHMIAKLHFKTTHQIIY